MKPVVVTCVIGVVLAACSKPAAPTWTRVSQDAPCVPGAAPEGAAPESAAAATCSGVVYFLDTANITRNSGVLYVTLQTRVQGDAAAAGYGIIHAEANCRLNKLEPSGLHEDVYNASGAKIETRLAVISAEDEATVVKHACAR